MAEDAVIFEKTDYKVTGAYRTMLSALMFSFRQINSRRIKQIKDAEMEDTSMEIPVELYGMKLIFASELLSMGSDMPIHGMQVTAQEWRAEFVHNKKPPPVFSAAHRYNHAYQRAALNGVNYFELASAPVVIEIWGDPSAFERDMVIAKMFA